MNEIIKRLIENKTNSNVSIVTLDSEKLQSAMEAYGYEYDEELVLEFLADKYGLEDGEHYQVGNGELEFLFYKDAPHLKDVLKELTECDMKEASAMDGVDPLFNEELQKYVGKPVKDLLYELDGRLRIDINTEKPTMRYGVSGYGGTVNQVTWEWADMTIISAKPGGTNDIYKVYIDVE